MPSAPARCSAWASGLSEPTATTSASRPWTRSKIAWRLVPAPEASTPTFTQPPISGSARRSSAACLGEQRVDTGEDVLVAQVRERAVVRQAVVGVLLHDL